MTDSVIHSDADYVDQNPWKIIASLVFQIVAANDVCSVC